VCIEPSLVCGDAPCPNCGCLLWFLNLSNRSFFLEHGESDDLRERAVRCIADQLGVSLNELTPDTELANKFEADSLDMVEFVMAFDEYFDR